MSRGNFNSGAPLYIHRYLERGENERACIARAASLSPVAAQTCAHYVWAEQGTIWWCNQSLSGKKKYLQFCEGLYYRIWSFMEPRASFISIKSAERLIKFRIYNVLLNTIMFMTKRREKLPRQQPGQNSRGKEWRETTRCSIRQS